MFSIVYWWLLLPILAVLVPGSACHARLNKKMLVRQAGGRNLRYKLFNQTRYRDIQFALFPAIQPPSS